MKSAYEIAKEISFCKNNIERRDYVYSVLSSGDFSLDNLVSQKNNLPVNCGNYNFILDSKKKNPFLITAHYDAAFLDGFYLTVPGANDNGSGVGAAISLFSKLKDEFPVRLVLFGGEENNLLGSSFYVEKILDELNTPRAVLNFDMCGSPGEFVISGARESFVERYSRVVEDFGYKIKEVCSYPSDHISFLSWGIEALTIGAINDWYSPYCEDNPSKNNFSRYHTQRDSIGAISQSFLEDVVKIGEVGTRKYFSKIGAESQISHLR